MKTIASAIILLAALLAGCASVRNNASDDAIGRASWAAFCDARGYDINDHTYPAVNEYLDTWCGSTEEESALAAKGIRL